MAVLSRYSDVDTPKLDQQSAAKLSDAQRRLAELHADAVARRMTGTVEVAINYRDGTAQTVKDNRVRH